jgi:DNA-binding NarL/FixJ family response regulator
MTPQRGAALEHPSRPSGPSEPIRLVLVDDHPVFLEGLADALTRQRDLTVVARTTRGGELLDIWGRHRPDLVLLDLALPGINGVAVLKQLRAAHPAARVLMLTSSEDQDDALAALDAGAAGYVTKRSGYGELVGAIREAHAGGRPIGEAMALRIAARERSGPLTRRELEVLAMIGDGIAYDDIGARLGITERTVRAHVVSAKEKLGAANTTHAVAICFTRGLLGPAREGR